MPTRNIPAATIQDVEAALIEQYGRVNIKENAKSDAQAQWTFRITSKSQGKCIAAKSSDGVSVTMSPSTHIALWILTAIGYVCFILPGLAFTVFLVITRFITARVIGYRFPKIVENIQRVAANRSGQ